MSEPTNQEPFGSDLPNGDTGGEFLVAGRGALDNATKYSRACP